MRIIAIVLAGTLAGCGSISLDLPVNGKMRGEFTSGFVTARGDGTGTLWVQNRPGGLRCEGDYSIPNGQRQFDLPIACNDGRTGTASVNLKPGGISGVALARLNDGTRGQFVFGRDVHYEEEFPGPDATIPAAEAVTTRSKRR